MQDIDYEYAIPNLIGSKFNVTQLRGSMFHYDDIYRNIPAVMFFLKQDENEDLSYKKIRASIESFVGNLGWALYKVPASRLSYEISPKINYELQVDSLNSPNGARMSRREQLGEKKYKEICDLAVADIPMLYQHMLSTL